MELRILQDTVATRAAEISSSVPDWPCRRGCDHCCRHLARLPEATQSEWNLVREGFWKLPTAAQAEIRERGLALDDERPVVCPFLERSAGVCLVYAERPMACRTYGFYVERGVGLYCGDIERKVELGELRNVVWGNQESIAVAQAAMGPLLSLREGLPEIAGAISGG